jgi:hypothetical protein
MMTELLDFQVEVFHLDNAHDGWLPAGGRFGAAEARKCGSSESCGTRLALERLLGKNTGLRNADSCRRLARCPADLRAVSHGSAISGVRPAGVAVARARSGRQAR